MTVRDEKGSHYSLGEQVRTDLADKWTSSCCARIRPST